MLAPQAIQNQFGFELQSKNRSSTVFPSHHDFMAGALLTSPEDLLILIQQRVSLGTKDLTPTDGRWTKEDLASSVAHAICDVACNTCAQECPTWSAYVTAFVEAALTSCSASCMDRLWFFKLDLGFVLGNVASHVLQKQEVPGATWQSVCKLAQRQFASWRHKALVQEAIHLAVSDVFADHAVQQTVYTRLRSAYDIALEFAASEPRPWDSYKIIELFIMTWIDDGLKQSWCALAGFGAERVLTEEVAAALFEKLVAPFGRQHTFSCIPDVFLASTFGRPPKNWPVIQHTIRVIFLQRRRQLRQAPASRKRPSSGSGGELVPFKARPVPCRPW